MSGILRVISKGQDASSDQILTSYNECPSLSELVCHADVRPPLADPTQLSELELMSVGGLLDVLDQSLAAGVERVDIDTVA